MSHQAGLRETADNVASTSHSSFRPLRTARRVSAVFMCVEVVVLMGCLPIVRQLDDGSYRTCTIVIIVVIVDC